MWPGGSCRIRLHLNLVCHQGICILLTMCTGSHSRVRSPPQETTYEDDVDFPKTEVVLRDVPAAGEHPGLQVRFCSWTPLFCLRTC